MDKRIIIGAVVVVLVLLVLPVAPKLMQKMAKPDPAADLASEQRIQQAVQAYAGRTGIYPPTLEALIPTYLEAVPSTSTGAPFQYDAATGAVRNPHPAPGGPGPEGGPAPRRAGRPVGGGGPMGEAMTGIGIANELQ